MMQAWEVFSKGRITVFGFNKCYHKKPQTRLGVLISTPAGYSGFEGFTLKFHAEEIAQVLGHKRL